MLMREVWFLEGRSGWPRPGWQCRERTSGGRGLWLVAGGDGRVPADAASDHDMQPAQQRGGAGGAGLLAGEPVVLAGGQVVEPGGEHGVVRQCGPHGAPGREPQLRATTTR